MSCCFAQNTLRPLFFLVIDRKWGPPFRSRLVLEEGNASSKTSEKLFLWLPSKPQQLQRVISSVWCHCTLIQLYSVCFLLQTFVLAVAPAVCAPCAHSPTGVFPGGWRGSSPQERCPPGKGDLAALPWCPLCPH